MAKKTKSRTPANKKAKNNSSTSSGSRVRKLSKKLKKVDKKNNQQVPGGFKILRTALANLNANKKLFLGLFVIYFILYFVFVKGLAANFQVSEIKDLLDTEFAGELSGVDRVSTLLGTLVGGASVVSGEGASVYQSVLFVVFSLAIIWALRQTTDGKKVSAKQSLYKSTHPLIPYILVYLVLFIQLIPMMVGVSLYGVILSNDIAISAAEQIIWLLLTIGAIFVSLYFGISTFIASYVVTLSGMEPIKSLRLAKNVVKYRRFLIIRRILFFVFIVLLFMGLVFVPLVLYVPIIAEVGFLLTSLFMLTVFHAYSYGLYRELI